MPLPLNLFKAFEKGEPLLLSLRNMDWKQPKQGYAWLVLYGTGYHVTGTDTIITVKKKEVTALSTTLNNLLILKLELSATASGYFNVFSTEASKTDAAWQPIVITEEMGLHMTGDGSANCEFVLLEWKM